MDLLLSKLNDKSLSITEFANAANHIIVTILHKAGEEVLSITSSETNHPRSAHADIIPHQTRRRPTAKRGYKSSRTD
jgi:hypothetical protein